MQFAHPQTPVTLAHRPGAGLLLFLVGALSAWGQINRGTIQGRVEDQTGAIVPGAQVGIVHLATNSSVEMMSNTEGLYTAPNLPMGNYRLMVKKAGFATVVREPVEVRPNVETRVDFMLKPGTVSEALTVTAEAPMLDVSATSNTAALQQQLIDELPVIVTGTKRDITSLLQNLPGVTSTGTFQTRANGAISGDTEVFIDGGGGGQFGIARGGINENGPFIEQVGEFSVVLNSFNAEYGGFGSWFTNVTIRSGTNQLHGSVWDHIGNSAFNARSFFQPYITPFRQNEGGFSVGGPVELPKLYNGRNKTFFFGSLGLFLSRSGSGNSIVTIPTPAFIRGDFSGLVNASGAQVPIFDPDTTQPDGKGSFVRTQFPGNVIPANRITKAAALISSYIPAPSLPGINNNFYDHRAPSWPFFDTFAPVVKIDHNISSKQKLSGLYTLQVRHRLLWGSPGSGLGPQPTWGGTQTNPLDWITDQLANSWKVRLNHDYVFSPSVLNHVTLSADRYYNRGANKTVGQGWDQKLGIMGVPNDNGAFPAISFSGGNALPVNFGRAYDENWHEMKYTFDENLSWIRGKHSMKFGGQVGTAAENRLNTGGVAGNFGFSNATTSQPDAPAASYSAWGSAFASFLLGAVATTAPISQNSNTIFPLEIGLRYRHYALFAQDEWHAAPGLTISYGLRWDFWPPFYEVHDYQTSFQPNLVNPAAGGRLGALGYSGSGPGKIGGGFQDTFYKGFGPRLGVAYQINSKTLIRASGGIYYSSTANNVPFASTDAQGYDASPSFVSADGYTPIFNWATQPFPQNFRRPPVIDPSFSNGQSITYIPRNGDRLPQIASWTFSIQRELIRSLSIDVTYIGNQGTHLAMGGGGSAINYVNSSYLSLGSVLLQPINSAPAAAAGFSAPFPGFASQLGANTVAQSLKPYPQYASIIADAAFVPQGRSRYNSLQIKASQRLSHGLTGTYFLTWQKSLTNVTGGNYTNNYAGDAQQYPGHLVLFEDTGVPPVMFGASFGYELPFGKGKTLLHSANAAVNQIVSGWQLNGFLRYTSGAPLTFVANSNLAPLGYGPTYDNYIGGQNPRAVTDPRNFNPARDKYLNPAAFAVPASFTLGNIAPAVDWVRGFTQKSESLNLTKRLRIRERIAVELGGDFINPFNFHRWSNPNTSITSPLFGVVSSAAAGRTIQINGTLKF